MRGAHSISTRRAYGLQRICRVWHCARSSVYARRQATTCLGAQLAISVNNCLHPEIRGPA